MGQKGVPLSNEVADKIVRLRDEQGLEFAIIAQRFGIKTYSARKIYDRRKANPDLDCSEAIDDLE